MINVTLGKIPEDFARITCDHVDPGGQLTVTLGGMDEDFVRITCDNVDPGWGVDQQSPREGSMKNFQGLPVTMLILGNQLKVTLDRIHKEFARITCDNVDTGG